MTTFLLAKLRDGTSVIGEFAKLVKVQRYVNQVFTGAKPFNAWRVVGTTHPVSGEAVALRTREMFNGSEVVSIAAVKRREGVGADSFVLADFEPVVEMARGEAGLWIAPSENTPEGAVAGTSYPIHRDNVTLGRYVILRAAGEGVEEMRHTLDAVRVGPSAYEGAEPGGFSGDEALDPDPDPDGDGEDVF